MLAAVVPLERDAALAPALVELVQGGLVLVHLLHHLGGQLHHRLVVADGQHQHVVGGQAALGQRQVTLGGRRTQEGGRETYGSLQGLLQESKQGTLSSFVVFIVCKY